MTTTALFKSRRPRLLLTTPNKLLNYHIVSLLNFQTVLATPMASICALTLPSKHKEYVMRLQPIVYIGRP